MNAKTLKVENDAVRFHLGTPGETAAAGLKSLKYDTRKWYHLFFAGSMCNTSQLIWLI
jgi:hypothetical protein